MVVVLKKKKKKELRVLHCQSLSTASTGNTVQDNIMLQWFK